MASKEQELPSYFTVMSFGIQSITITDFIFPTKITGNKVQSLLSYRQKMTPESFYMLERGQSKHSNNSFYILVGNVDSIFEINLQELLVLPGNMCKVVWNCLFSLLGTDLLPGCTKILKSYSPKIAKP